MPQSFDIKNSTDLFKEFRNRIDEYFKEPLSSGNAVICAMFAWHIADWIYQEFSSISSRYNKIKNFQADLKQNCSSLSYMQDIANGTKHKSITFYVPEVKSAEKHGGAFPSDFNKSFDIPRLKLTLQNGNIVYFDEEIVKVREFWKNYFTKTLGMNV